MLSILTRHTQSLTPSLSLSKLPAMLTPGDKIEATIEAIGSHGEGFFRTDAETVFVAKTAPGDKVLVEIVAKKGRQVRARVLEVFARGSLYREPACQHFWECGGCDFQHLPYEAQLNWKQTITRHWIERSPLQPFTKNLELELIRSPQEFNYRHRARVQFLEGRPAFRKARSHHPVFLKECPVLVEGFFEAIEKKAQAERTNHDRSLLYLHEDLAEKSTYSLDNYEVAVHEESFSQANLFTNELMWARIQEDVVDLPAKTRALDLFCGSGNFSIGLKKHFEEVYGIESNPLSIELARETQPNIHWILGAVERNLQQLLKRTPKFDFCLLDPSREGALKAVRILAEHKLPRITYVSCQLDTLIRDLTHLVKKSSYVIERWSVADLFPQTKHIESIVSLRFSKA